MEIRYLPAGLKLSDWSGTASEIHAKTGSDTYCGPNPVQFSRRAHSKLARMGFEQMFERGRGTGDDHSLGEHAWDEFEPGKCGLAGLEGDASLVSGGAGEQSAETRVTRPSRGGVSEQGERGQVHLGSHKTHRCAHPMARGPCGSPAGAAPGNAGRASRLATRSRLTRAPPSVPASTEPAPAARRAPRRPDRTAPSPRPSRPVSGPPRPSPARWASCTTVTLRSHSRSGA